VSEGDVEVRYLDLDDILDVTRFATALDPVIRDIGLLESAIHRPRSSAFGVDAYPDLAMKAAALLESLVRNHALVDGNKRTAWVSCWLFLRLNGWHLKGPVDAAFDLVIGIAEGRVDLADLADTAAALEGWSTPEP